VFKGKVIKKENNLGFQTKWVVPASPFKKCFEGQKPLGVNKGLWAFTMTGK
jgi:hypothetical protein